MRSLYQLEVWEQNLAAMIEDAQGEITDEIEQEMNRLEKAPTEICLSLVNIQEDFDMHIDALDAKIKQLQDAKRKCETAKASIKEKILQVMEHTGQKTLENDLVKITRVVAKNNGLEVTDALLVPDIYKKHTIVVSNSDFEKLNFLGVEYDGHKMNIDKKQLKADMKANTDIGVAGAVLKDSVSLRIKH